MRIEAALLRKPGEPFSIEELELEQPRADEVLVQIAGVGLCHTDLSCRDLMYPVPLPSILGHEGSGVVAAVGRDVTKVQPGDHVVLSYRACGTCRNCERNDPSHCLHIFESNFSGVREDGSCIHSQAGQPVHGNFFGQSSFATYALANQTNTVKVSKQAPLKLLGPLGCGVQTGAGAVLNSFQAESGSSLAVFGCGAVGLSAIMAAKVAGCCPIIAVDIHPERLRLAKTLGATETVNPMDCSVVEIIHEITTGGADYSLECTAKPAVFRQALESLCVTGVCGLVGAAPMGTEVTFDMNSIMFGRTLKGIIEGDSIPDQFIPQLVALYLDGKFPLQKLVSYYPLREINQAVQDVEQGRVVKPVLLP